MANFKTYCRQSAILVIAVLVVAGSAVHAEANPGKTDKTAKTDKPSETKPPAKMETPKKKPAVFEAPPAPPKTKLLLPVVFHLGDSELWKDGQSLKPVFAEMQRIFDQAGIVLQPQFATKGEETKHIDIVFLVKIGTKSRGPNGISLGRRSRVLVRDNVGLRRLKDQRPIDAIPVPAAFPNAKLGETIEVDMEQAEQARTTAHEVGHQLRLSHRQDLFNLMASGTTGWTLNQQEIDRMREAAIQKFGAKEVK